LIFSAESSAEAEVKATSNGDASEGEDDDWMEEAKVLFAGNQKKKEGLIDLHAYVLEYGQILA
jgi:hypothetical protein